jgi:site-specific recombinase
MSHAKARQKHILKKRRTLGRTILKREARRKTRYGYVFGKTYEETEQKLEAALESAHALGSSVTSFENIASEWLRQQQPELKASSYSKYANMLRLYPNPRFGNAAIPDISRNEVQQFSRDMLLTGGTAKTGLAPKTVNSAISILKNILEYARKERGLQVADIKDVSVREQKKHMQVFSRAEQSILSRHLCNNPSPCNIGILLCLYTEMRIGEICALKWGDIMLNEQYLFVHQTMQRIQLNGDENKKTKVVIGPPKSECSIRKIPIPAEMLQLLIPVKKQNEAFLLTGMVHSYIEPRCMENQFKSVIDECGVSDLNFHALRHTFATRCIELGFDIKSLSEILG